MLQNVQDLGVIGGRRLFEVFPVMSDGRTNNVYSAKSALIVSLRMDIIS